MTPLSSAEIDDILVGLDRPGDTNHLREGGRLHRGHLHVEDPGIAGLLLRPLGLALPPQAPEAQGQEEKGWQRRSPPLARRPGRDARVLSFIV